MAIMKGNKETNNKIKKDIHFTEKKLKFILDEERTIGNFL